MIPAPTRRLLGVLLLCLPCVGLAQSPPPPRLVRQPLPDLPVDVVDRPQLASFAVSPSGWIVVAAPRAEPGEFRLWVLDPAGRVAHRLARRGKGPGELETPLWLAFPHDTVVVAWDMATARLSWFHPSGRYLHGRVLEDLNRAPRAATPDWVYLVSSLPDTPRLSRVSWQAGPVEVLIPEREETFQRVFPSSPGLAVIPFAMGTDGRTVAFAHTHEYHILFYDAGGRPTGEAARTLPPRMPTARAIEEHRAGFAAYRGPDGRGFDKANIDQRVARFRTAPQPHFRNGGLGFDARGRLWVVGMVGDSVFADVFQGTAFLARQAMGCLGGGTTWSLNGNWLGLTCHTRDPDAASEGTIQLYRIEDR